jgi:LysR family transcriptional regulator, regulator for bpeEF and oprC
LAVVTCAAPAYLERYGTPTSLEDLEQHRFVNFFSPKTGSVFPFDFARGTEVRQINRPHFVSANDSDTYIAAGASGMGIMQVPSNRIVREHLGAGRLIAVLRDWSAGELPMVVLYPRNRHLTAKVRAFTEWAAELYRQELAP